MGLPGVGRPVRVVREPERAEPIEMPEVEPERETVPAEPREPVKV
jgi:hypothetical protein